METIDDLLQSALQVPGDERGEFLRHACGDDRGVASGSFFPAAIAS